MERFRYHAFVIIETDTPVSVGSGEKGINVDRLIVKDANGLPYIPGTGLAGALRAEFTAYAGKTAKVNDLFGYQQGKEGQGSRLLISSAHLIDHSGQAVIEGLVPQLADDPYYQILGKLPDRDHVRITSKGGADTEGHGKYNEELLHKGVRMAFRLELISQQEDDQDWQQLLDILHLPTFRIGGGTRKGYGKLAIRKCLVRQFDLQQRSDLIDYLKLDNSLNVDRDHWTPYEAVIDQSDSPWLQYKLQLSAADFFLFGASHGDKDADLVPKTETFIDWSTGKPQLTSQEHLLMPATSLKGALAHRTAFHFNRLNQQFADNSKGDFPQPRLDIPGMLALLDGKAEQEDRVYAAMDSDEATLLPSEQATDSEQFPQGSRIPELKREIQQLEQSTKRLNAEKKKLEQKLQYAAGFNNIADRDASDQWKIFEKELKEYTDQLSEAEPTGENNQAVRALFGYANDSTASGQRGHVLIPDVYLPWDAKKQNKVFNHVSIDRFTGGNMDGMLFSQKVASMRDPIEIPVYVHRQALQQAQVKEAFEEALRDLCEGRLALGGATTKGHGIFKGHFNN